MSSKLKTWSERHRALTTWTLLCAGAGSFAALTNLVTRGMA